MPQKLTNEEFLNKMKDIKPTIHILTEYINNRTKVLCKCLIDDYEWYATPRDLMQGKGCPKCGGTMRKNHNDFIKELQVINPNIEILGSYINNKTKVKCKCLIDGHEWYAIPNSLLKGHGCPICGGWVKKTNEEFINELKIINPNITIIDIYKNRRTKVKCKCKIDNSEWYAMPYSLLSGAGCPLCGILSSANSKTKSYEQFIDELQAINPNIEIIGKYINTNTKVECRCKIDGCKWTALPNNLLQGHGCPQCNNNSRGENRITVFLDKYRINYVPQKKFDNCKDKYALPFDFLPT